MSDSSNKSETLKPGAEVGAGRYQLIKILGRGGMGVVWLAEDTRLNGQVALKFLPPEISGDAVALEDMRRETKKAHGLTHQNIVRIHDLFEGEGEAPFISMEYVEGLNLNDQRLRTEEKVFDWEFLLPLLRQLCHALEYAHGEGVIHRDIKPANLMLDAKGRLKLADFGIAAQAADSVNRVSLRNLSSGTVTHMSPQQMDGEPPAVTDDIYSVGATFYELISGKPPFYSGDIVYQVRNKEATSLEQRMADLAVENPAPPETVTVVMGCLFKNPEYRPQSAADVLVWLGQPSLATMSSVEPAAGPSQPESAPTRRARNVNRVAMITTVVVAVAAFASLMMKSPEGESSAQGSASTLEPTVASVKNLPTPGSLDLSFDPGSGADKGVYRMVCRADGKPVIIGPFEEFGGIPRNSIARLNLDGSVDETFDIGSGPAARTPFFSRIMALRNGKYLVSGSFISVSGLNRSGHAQLNGDGSVDADFVIDLRVNFGAHAQLELRDGRILIGGWWSEAPGPYDGLVMIHPDGKVDETFKPGPGLRKKKDDVRGLAELDDGKIIVAGVFESFSGAQRKNLLRLNPDGSLDDTFSAEGQPDQAVSVMAIDDRGRILIGGIFGKVGAVERFNLARLYPDGSVDRSFVAGFKPDEEGHNGITSIALQPDGKILVAGRFKRYAGMSRRGVARLNQDGSLDGSFDSGPGTDDTAGQVVLSPDGKIYIFGRFTRYNGIARNGMARLHGDMPISANSAKGLDVHLPGVASAGN